MLLYTRERLIRWPIDQLPCRGLQLLQEFVNDPVLHDQALDNALQALVTS